MHPAFDFISRSALEMKIEFINVAVWHFDKRDLAGQAAVVPPVRLQRGYAVREPGAVHGDDGEVISVSKGLRDFAIESGKTSFVFADRAAIDPEIGAIICCSNVQEDALTRSLVVLKILLVPERPFVEHQRLALGVPVTGNLQGGRFCEIVLDRAGGIGLCQVSCKASASG